MEQKKKPEIDPHLEKIKRSQVACNFQTSKEGEGEWGGRERGRVYRIKLKDAMIVIDIRN